MSFEELQAKVARAENALEAHERRVAADVRVFGACWRQAWSPPRVIGAGLAAGFLAGWVRPGRAVAGVEPARWLQLAGSLAGMFGSIHAAFAASDAQEAADEAGAVATAAATGTAPPDTPASATAAPGAGPRPEPATAPGGPQAPPSARRFVPDPQWDSPPRPAEAATDVSEQR